MSETWGLDMNGGPHHIGKCTCGNDSGTCYDELCEECIAEQPRKCPDCGCNYSWTEFTSEGICTMCADIEAEEKAEQLEEQTV